MTRITGTIRVTGVIRMMKMTGMAWMTRTTSTCMTRVME